MLFKNLSIYFFLATAASFLSCGNTVSTKKETSADIKTYAQNFNIIEEKGYRIIEVTNIIDNSEEKRKYVLYHDKPPQHIADAVFIKYPIKNIACLSTTHAAMLSALDADTLLSAATNTNLLYSPRLSARAKTGKITEIGNETSLNYETLVNLQPDIVFTYGLNNLEQVNKLKALGLNAVVVAEFRENTPLARAEWLKFFGAFVDKTNLADSLFQTIAEEYNGLMAKTSQVATHPKVFTGVPFQGIWYVPAGQSFVAQYINDAGGDYIWKEEAGQLSLSLSFEAVFEKAYDTEKWLDVGFVFSKSDVANMDNRFTQFQAFQTGEMYNYTKRVSPQGGFDIYESAVVFPNVVLKDFIKILHPELLPDHQLFYYEQLQ